MNVFDVESGFMLLVLVIVVGVKIYAFANSLMFSAESYPAANKLTKPAWGIILGLGLVLQLLWVSPLNMINLAFTIAAFVYLADVRPALRSLTRRR